MSAVLARIGTYLLILLLLLSFSASLCALTLGVLFPLAPLESVTPLAFLRREPAPFRTRELALLVGPVEAEPLVPVALLGVTGLAAKDILPHTLRFMAAGAATCVLLTLLF